MAYEGLTRFGGSEQARRSQRLIAGPWNHNGMQVRPDADPATWMFFDFRPDTPIMRFFEHHLKDRLPEYPEEPPVRVYVMGENVWRDEQEWPLARTDWTPFYLHGTAGEGRLSTHLPADEKPDSFVVRPAGSGPGLGCTRADLRRSRRSSFRR